jgi:predicted O-methyltransferase YrrM
MLAVERLVAPEAAAVTDARARAAGHEPPSPSDCALIAWAAVTTGARTIVEVGSCGGVSTVWLASVLAERGTVTSLEPDPDVHSLTSESVELAGLSDRVRSIAGEPSEVLPRLADGGYDLVLLQVAGPRLVGLVDHAERILRPGGVLVVRPRGDVAVALAVTERLVSSDALAATAATGDDGMMLVATRRADPEPDAEPDGTED